MALCQFQWHISKNWGSPFCKSLCLKNSWVRQDWLAQRESVRLQIQQSGFNSARGQKYVMWKKDFRTRGKYTVRQLFVILCNKTRKKSNNAIYWRNGKWIFTNPLSERERSLNKSVLWRLTDVVIYSTTQHYNRLYNHYIISQHA